MRYTSPPAAADRLRGSPPDALLTPHLRPSLLRHARTTRGLLASFAVLAACNRGDHTGVRGDSVAGAIPAASIEREPASTYRPVPLETFGRVDGVVDVDGVLPADTLVAPTSDHTVCRNSFTDPTIMASGNHLGGAIVWIPGIVEGKRLPLTRRYELVHTRCLAQPRTQAVIAGGTLNVRSDDAIPHRARFLRHRTQETLRLVAQTGDGQVVPVTDVLAHPAHLEVRCDYHPWTRAWVAVFDHPYFMVTERDGAFSLDSVPPGRYRLVAWHERFGSVEDSVTVEANGRARVRLVFRGAVIW